MLLRILWLAQRVCVQSSWSVFHCNTLKQQPRAAHVHTRLRGIGRCIIFTLRHERKSRFASKPLELIDKCREDPQLMSTFLDALPAWLTSPTIERVSWFNSILQQFWPHVNTSLGDVTKNHLFGLCLLGSPRLLRDRMLACVFCCLIVT